MDAQLGPEQQRSDSSEGTQQGQPPSSLLFCVGIQPELRSLDAELTPYGGCARGDMDDIYAMGPARAVFPAVERFVTRLREMLNLEIQHNTVSLRAGRGTTTWLAARGARGRASPWAASRSAATARAVAWRTA